MKHAYLIMAHNQFDLLEKQLILLDDIRNDIYLHIDKKVKDFDFLYFKNLIKKSNIFFIDRIDVHWGGYSFIKCEMQLLKLSVNKKYDYYHLLSGVDLPLKNQDYIHNFFCRNHGKEFVNFGSDDWINSVKYRVLYYHLLPKYFRLNNPLLNTTQNKIRSVILKTQKLLNIKKNIDSDLKIKAGCNWFSITHEFASYVVNKNDWVKKYFKASLCGDELFLQTILFNSKFNKNTYLQGKGYESCMRLIDWERGDPYTFQNNDFDYLIKSKKLFARKFNYSTDSIVIDNIFNILQKNKNTNITNK